MNIQQFVMAYGAEQDRLRALLPEGYTSLRPVLRINAEIRTAAAEADAAESTAERAETYLEFNTPVEKDGIRGWLNIASWQDVPFECSGNAVTFRTDFLQITFTATGREGGCPAEKDNDGCFFPGKTPELRLPETITVNKEYCDCSFAWKFPEGKAGGTSEGKTLPAFLEEERVQYPKEELTAERAAAIPCRQVLGAYKVCFERLSEKEKMERGVLYDANYDPQLLLERQAAKDLCFAFNALKPSDEAGQKNLLQRILGHMGENCTILAPFWCDYGYNISVGDNFFANHGLVILDGARVTFGDNVFIAPNCGFHTAGHPIDYRRRNAGLEYARPITVGDNVWFGAGVQVVPGVAIGSNVVIGAGSVVTKDIPSGVVAAGNPCRVIRPITEEDGKR